MSTQVNVRRKSDSKSKKTLNKALLKSVKKGDAEAIQYCLQQGADPDCIDPDPLRRRPLHFAASKKNDSCMKILLENGADPNSKDQFGSAAAHVAASYGYLKKIKLLHKHGARLDEGNKWGVTPLELAEKLKQLKTAEFLRNH